MNLNSTKMILQPTGVLENSFPSFDNLMFTLPKSKVFHEGRIDEERKTEIKLQMIEEKLKNIENKNSRLEAINRNIILKNNSMSLNNSTSLNETKHIDANPHLNNDHNLVIQNS